MMPSEAINAITATVAAIIGLAIVAVIVSQQANTSGVLTSGGTALAGIIQAATSPVSNNQNNILSSSGIANGGIGITNT